MRTLKLFIAIMAALALRALPVAAQARGGHGRHPARAAGVVRSFKAGVLSIRTAGGGVRSADVTGDTRLSCERRPAQRRRAHGRRARAAADPEDDSADDPGDDSADDPGDDAGDDSADDPGEDGEDAGDDTGDDAGDDTGVEGPDHGARQRQRGCKGACSLSALRRGAKVKSAKLGGDGARWAKIVLVRR